MNNANDLEKIKTKVKKLLALSKSDNENESLSALNKANELIGQYGLDEESLRFEFVRVKSTKTYVSWRALVANAVSWLYACYKYRDYYQGELVFTGEGLGAFMAGEMFAYLINTIERCAKKSVRKNASFKYRRDFKYGMASRIYDRIMELGESCSWSPRRGVKIEEAKNFVKKSVELNFKEFNKVKLNLTAVNRGVFYGDGVSLARQAGYTPVPRIAAP
jgi:hypothetical protein